MSFALDSLTVCVAALAFLLAGFVKGVTGLGLPPVAMGLLGLVMPPAQAAALMVLPAFVTNVRQLAAGPRFGALAHRLWPLLAGSVLGTLAAGWLLHGRFGNGATAVLGAALMAYAVLGLSAPRLAVPPRAERWLAPLVGLATGVVTAATGVSTMPAVPYLGALGLAKDALIQALGLSFTVSTVALAIALAGNGVLGPTAAAASLLALGPALLGLALGTRLRDRLDERVFRRCFLLSLLALGAHLVVRTVL